MPKKILQSHSGSKKNIFIFFFYKISDKLSEIINDIDGLYNVYFFNLECFIPELEGDYKEDTLRRNVHEINFLYESKILNSVLQPKDIIFISDDAVTVPFLSWLHDFAPRFNSAILFSLNSLSLSSHSFILKKLSYDSHSVVSPIMVILSKKNKYGEKFFTSISNKNFSSFILNDSAKSPSLNENVKSFIELSSIKFKENSPFINADKKGFTYEESARLAIPEKNNLKKIYWTVHWILLRIAGFFSDGIKTGIVHGFDSGAMLDYIYNNRPKGKWVIGKYFDKLYLSSIAWRGARHREQCVHTYLIESINHYSDSGFNVNILDIASGHAKYLFNLKDNDFKKINNIILHDYDEYNFNIIKHVINKRKLDGIISCKKGDAFSALDLASLPTDRTIAVASGFYELFDNNENVLQSLKGIFSTLKEEGVFIYTNFLWHPRHTYMARVMTRNEDKKPWLIRRRFQQEIDDLVRLAGFTKISQKIDPWGIFSVSLAKKLTFSERTTFPLQQRNCS